MKHQFSSSTLPTLILIFASIASWAYCISTGNFNGDLWPKEITLSRVTLFFALIATIIPYLIAWRLDKYFAIRASRLKKVFVPKRLLEVLLFSVFLWHISMTIAFDAGVMDQAVYEAPGWIKPLIQIGNRIDPAFVCVFYILASPKRPMNDLKASLLLITLGFLRASMGSFFYIIITLIIKYRPEGLKIIRRHLLIIVLLLIATPFMLSTLYDVRSSLRGAAKTELVLSDLVFAKISGRLSSYSNFLYIVQEAADFKSATQSLPSFYYPLQIAGGVFDGSLAPMVTPEKIMINATLSYDGYSYDGYSTYMTGVLGNLLLAWFISPLVAIFNLFLMIFMITLTVRIAHRFGNGNASSVGLVMLLYPLTSGVSYEFAILLLNCMAVYFLCRAKGKMSYLSNMPPVKYSTSN